MPSALINLLNARMSALGLIPATLAAKADMPKQTLSNILKGTSKPELPQLAKLAGALETPLWKLVEASGYAVGGPLTPDDQTLRLAHLLRDLPWLESGVERMAELSPEEFEDLLTYMEFRSQQRAQKEQG